jgi:uncharacterized membrane protein YdjX (TVP38/TMEM64 family)
MLRRMRARLHRFTRIVLVATIATATLWVLPRLEQIDTDELRVWLGTFGPFAPLLFVAARTGGAVVFVPGSIMAFTAGMLFGPVWGAAYNLVASTLGAITAFGIARYLAPAWIADHIAGRERLRRLADGIRTNGWKFVAFVRIVPLFPYNVVNYAFGLTPVRFVEYAWASAVFMIPADVAYVYLGFAGREALRGNDHAWALALAAFGALACLAAIPAVYKLYNTRKLRAAAE